MIWKYIQNSTGNVLFTNFADNSDIIFKSDNGSGGTSTYILIDGGTGAVELSYYGTKKIETTSAGATVTGDLTVTGSITGSGGSFLPLAGGTMTGTTSHGDNVKAIFGTGNDLEIYHSGSSSFIRNAGSGKLILDTDSTGINVQSATGETRFTKSGANSEIKIDDSSQTNKVVLKASGNSYFIGGNLGINTTSPSEKIEVDGNIKLVDNGTAIFGLGS